MPKTEANNVYGNEPPYSIQEPIKYDEYEMLIVPLRDEFNNVLYNKVTGEVKWKIASRSFQAQYDKIIEDYGVAGENYLRSFGSLPRLCVAWYGSIIDQMEIKLIEIVNRVYLNSNKKENQLGVTFLKAMAKEYGKDFLEGEQLSEDGNYSTEAVEKAMKECIGSIVSSQVDLHKYNHPKEFEEHFLYPGNLYRLNDTDKKKYYEYIREYYAINRIYMPDFSDAEIYQFFLKSRNS